ncbi:MAG: hypothetical protein PUD22_06715 [Erysipelotrichaceae bacterium]|nr:hypothetical protein [Erysipelotrichaceae bacterium]
MKGSTKKSQPNKWTVAAAGCLGQGTQEANSKGIDINHQSPQAEEDSSVQWNSKDTYDKPTTCKV